MIAVSDFQAPQALGGAGNKTFSMVILDAGHRSRI